MNRDDESIEWPVIILYARENEIMKNQYTCSDNLRWSVNNEVIMV